MKGSGGKGKVKKGKGKGKGISLKGSREDFPFLGGGART